MAKTRTSPDTKALVRYLGLNQPYLSYRKIAKKCKISKTSAQRICQPDKRKSVCIKPKTCKLGRPNKLNERSIRILIRTVEVLREKNVNFTVKQLVEASGLSLNLVNRRTYSRYLNKYGYKYLQSRKKGLLNNRDRIARRKYARKAKSILSQTPNFYTDEVAFFLDGVSFVHKTNPLNTACQPKARVWRKKGEGLKLTSKGSKNLAEGRRVHVMVAVAYGKGVILREIYEHMNGTFFADFIKKHFNICFARAGSKQNGRRLFIMDNDPSQSSKVAMSALEEVEAELHKIPARSPDLNPIENTFHLIKKKLEQEAIYLQIMNESFDCFSVL